MKDEMDILLRRLDDRTLKDKLICFLCRHVPHRNKFDHHWSMPVWWVFFFGGVYDSGNGEGWRPNLYHTIRNGIRRWKLKREEYKYWQEHYKKYECETGSQVKCSTDNGKTYHDATPL